MKSSKSVRLYVCPHSSVNASDLIKLLCFVLVMVRCASSATPIALTPAAPVVSSGQTVTVTSSVPVSWQLIGGGTLQNQTATSVTFTAPQVSVKNPVMGCPAGPNDSIFNTRVDNLPVDPNSSSWMTWANIGPLTIETSNWGISYADASTPTKSFKTYFGSAAYPNFVMPAQGPNMKRQGGNYIGTFGWTTNPDHHIVTVRHTDCSIYESYDDYLNGYLRTCHDGTAGCNVEGAIAYNSTDYAAAMSSVTNAGGLPLAPTVWRLDEIKSGNITHAGYLTTFVGGILANAVRWPATATAGGCISSSCPSAMPMGARLRLAASFNISAVCNSGISQQDNACQTLLTAMKQYGFILSDTGTTNALETLSDVSQDIYVSGAIKAITAAKMAMTNFEVVDESSLEVSASSFAVCPFNQSCLSGANTYEKPQDQSVIVARTADGSILSTPVAVQGVGIGLGVSSVMPIASGSYSFQIPYWVNGTPNQTVNWVLQSGAGSVTSSGLYTPPATAASVETAVLVGTSAANPNATVQVHLNVLPTGASPSGSVRIDSGSLTATTDAANLVWSADVGVDGASASVTGDWPNWNKSNPAATMVYQSAQLSDGNDIGYNIVVPNGHYKVHLLFGQNSQGLCNVSCTNWLALPNTPWDQYSFGPYLLETQGQIQAHNFSFGAQAAYAFQSPVDAWIPAVASSNLLQVYVRGLTNDVAPYLTPQGSDQHKIIELNGIEIQPDSTTPYWAIDTQSQVGINPGQTLAPFYVVDWYTGHNDPSWSIVSGQPGVSISSTGVLTFAAGSLSNGQPIVVMASDGTYSATVTINAPASPKPAVTVSAITSSAAALQFSAQPISSASAAQSITLTNAGTATVTFGGSALSGTNSADFNISNSTCGSSLAGAATCTISISFNPAAAGSRTATLSITDSAGNSPQNIALSGTGTASVPPQSSASYIGADTTTQGTWTGNYGADGYVIANGIASIPAYSKISFANASSYTWAAPSTNPGALQLSPGSSSRMASTYAGSSFTINVNLTDGNTHQVSLYLFDYQGNSRAESISIVDAATGTVLDTRSYSTFTNGEYASWNIRGNVMIQINATGTINAVVGGLFFSPVAPVAASANYSGLDTTTQGTWTGTYGADGYVIANGNAIIPAYVTANFANASTYTWASPTTDLRGMQTSASATTRIASTYAGSSFSFPVAFTDGNMHQVALYLLDFDNSARTDTITIVDAVSHAVLSTQSFANFTGGQYAVWNITGNVIIQVAKNGSTNAVVAGIFFGK